MVIENGKVVVVDGDWAPIWAWVSEVERRRRRRAVRGCGYDHFEEGDLREV